MDEKSELGVPENQERPQLQSWLVKHHFFSPILLGLARAEMYVMGNQYTTLREV